ncbi:hypothetical protein NL676_031213 [Syzygium grande]|nr:hypothetical protein NL676_031213 [Syzygium grande]
MIASPAAAKEPPSQQPITADSYYHARTTTSWLFGGVFPHRSFPIDISTFAKPEPATGSSTRTPFVDEIPLPIHLQAPP